MESFRISQGGSPALRDTVWGLRRRELSCLSVIRKMDRPLRYRKAMPNFFSVSEDGSNLREVDVLGGLPRAHGIHIENAMRMSRGFD